MYYLCEKHYKPITVNKYYIVSCLSWVPKQMLLELWTNWTYNEVLE